MVERLTHPPASLWRDLQDHDIELHLAAIKSPVLDRLRQSKLLDYIGGDHLHLTTHDAMKSLGYVVEEEGMAGADSPQLDRIPGCAGFAFGRL